MKKLVFLLLLCLTQTVGATAELTFSPLKPTYHVGECISLKLQENLQAASRFHRVDLWVAVQLPSSDLLFMTPLAFTPFSPIPQLFRESLEATKKVHDILDFEVVVGLSGHYIFYAAYVKEGKNPITDSFSVLQSNLAEVSTTLSDEPPLTPVVDCVSVLPSPSNPFAEAGDTSVLLSWEPVTDADSYVVYWQASDGSGASISVKATSYMHEGLINGVSYRYSVTAMDTMGVEGIASITVAAIPNAGVTPPPAPTALSAEAGNAQVVFTWQAVTGAASYTVYWQSAGGAVESRSVSGTVFTHKGLVNGTSYTYWVTAMNAAGLESSPSASIAATPEVAPPVVPPIVVEPPPIVVEPPPVVESPPSPSPSSYRYTDNGNGTVTDNRSGLIWLKNANCFGRQAWDTAEQIVASLANGQCGLSDGSTSGMWRLPTEDEWRAMVDKSYSPALSNAAGTGQWTEGDAFSGVQSDDDYWSSSGTNVTTRAIRWNDGPYFGYGDYSRYNTNYVWPVRDGNSPIAESSPSPAPSSYRYTDNGNGTVTDNRSGLIWLKDANCFGEQDWGTAMQSAANLANGECGLSDSSTLGMWRLPIKEEWEAMVDRNYSNPALSNVTGTGQLTEGDPFLSVQWNVYWSSTHVSTTYAVNLFDGFVFTIGKDFSNYVWPVRGWSGY